MKLVFVGLPDRDAFAIKLMVRKDHPECVCEAMSAHQMPWPEADLILLDVEGWQAEDDTPADWSAAIGQRPAVIVTPIVSQRDDLRQAAEQRAADWARHGWAVVRRPLHTTDVREALATALRGTQDTPPADAPRGPPAPAIVADPPAPAPPSEAIEVTRVMARGFAPPPPAPRMPTPQNVEFGDGALTLAEFDAVLDTSPHAPSRAILRRLAEQLQQGQPFELMVTVLNGAIFHPAQGWVANNTPASVLRMVFKSRMLSEQTQIMAMPPNADPRQRAERRGMDFHPLEVMLYVLAMVTECRMPD